MTIAFASLDVNVAAGCVTDNTQFAGDVMTSLSLWRHATACMHSAHTQWGTHTQREERHMQSEHIIPAIHYVHLAEVKI